MEDTITPVFKKHTNQADCNDSGKYIQRGYRYRLYPNKDQQASLAIQFGHCRWVYNWGLCTRQQYYREHRTSLGFFTLKKMLPTLKRQPEAEWLKEADSQALQAKLEDLNLAYINFFEGRARYPKPKTKKDEQSIRYPQRFRLDKQARGIYLPKVGLVRCVYHREWEGTPRSVTVSKTKSGEFYVSVLCLCKVVRTTATAPNSADGPSVGLPSMGLPSVGADLGLKDFAVLHMGDGVERVEHPKYLRKAEAKLKILHRDLSRKKSGSHNREKARIALARGYEHVSRQREDFLHKLSTRMVREHSLIRLETLSVCGMVRNHTLAKSISDSGWGMFRQMCEYKGAWYDCTVERVDRFYPSSKTCSVCGYINEELQLHHRFWVCPGCGAEHDRDANAALNLLQAPSRRLVPCGQNASGRSRATGMAAGKSNGKNNRPKRPGSTVGVTGTDARRDRVRREGFQAQRNGRRSEKPDPKGVGQLT